MLRTLAVPCAVLACLSVAAAAAAERPDPPPEESSAATGEREPDADNPRADVEVVVTATFRDTVARDIPASVVVLDREAVRDGAVQHFEELATRVPDLNGSGEGNRTRYWQIRGIGEREQYTGAPNPSVGFVVDDVDFSGIGGIATLWDVDQVDVLRGPQGTRYGANALAGLIYVRSAPPPDRFRADAEVTFGSDATRALGFAAGGPVARDGSVAYRVAVQRHASDGFRDNRALGRDDTHGRDETTVRGKLRIAPSDRWTLDLTGFWIDLDDGYDAFSLDSGFVTDSDRPGRDAQRTSAGSLRVTGAAADAFRVVAITSAASTDGVFSFDADWGSAESWAPYTYDFFSETRRKRTTLAQEVRLVSTPAGRFAGGRAGWVAGVHVARLDESDATRDDGVYLDPAFPDDPFVLDAAVARDYRADTAALFGEVSIALAPRTDLDIGLRGERRVARYRDDAGAAFDPDETMVGGQITLARDVGRTARAYARLARGYKAGGFNPGLPADADDALRLFGPETLWNLEFGLKDRRRDGTLAYDVVAFAAARRDQQVETSTQLEPGNPTTFVFLTDNAGRGWNAGIEASASWQATRSVRLDGALAWLETEIVEFGADTSLEGRDQAHAPRFSGALGGTWRGARGRFVRVDLVGRSSFYFDDSHDRRSEPYVLTHARAGIERDRWSAWLWVRNAFDEAWAVRGFYFGNEPPDFPDRLYVKRGDPRQFGLTVRLSIGS